MEQKLFRVKYDIQILDGIETCIGYMYGKNDIEVTQLINQIAYDLKSDEHIIDVVEEVKMENIKETEFELGRTQGRIEVEKEHSDNEKLIQEKDKIFVNREKACLNCKSDNTYLTNLREGFNYRCNNCGEYFK